MQLVIYPELKDSWLEAAGFPTGTVLLIDDGPGPLLQKRTRIVIRDQQTHAFEFRLAGVTLQRVLIKRCVENGCLLPGMTQIVLWESPQP